MNQSENTKKKKQEKNTQKSNILKTAVKTSRIRQNMVINKNKNKR